ncbi:MAG: protein-glutamate O-methyltransferase CheR [Gammaproteobacteria bacterium]|nr:protein-glutamate O-methyltransferase CheR [Gammaproteobacteria bacterium]MCF6261710.1 protein-glutamate O-methyltransferase CheR [Gammaproteobacteria bacterium]
MTSTITTEDYQSFRKFLEDACGIVLGDNKQYLVTSRLTKLISDNEIDSFSTLMKRMKVDGKLRNCIMDAMTTNETSWFRDVYPFDILKEKLLPELIKAQPRTIRIWSAACSTGQEPYSLSMMVQEYSQSKPGSLSTNAVQIIGTDISPSVLAVAKSGVYEGVAVSRGLPEERKARFFQETSESWEVSADIKKRVSFRELNLMQNYTLLGRFDIIYCRNVLIYFSTELKRDILARMAKCLNPGGFLVLGGSESITNYSNEFDLIRWRNGVIYQLKS